MDSVAVLPAAGKAVHLFKDSNIPMFVKTVGKTLTILLCFAVLGGGLALPVMAQTSPAAPSADDFIPEIPLPKLFEGPQKMDNNLMANYVRAIFIYFVWVVGIVATVMVIYGGIKWVAAAGNPGQIKDARDIIDSAVIGVIIALTSVVLLNIINPKLTSLNIAGLNPVVNKEFGLEPPLIYKDADGNCFPSNLIPCGLVCLDLKTNKNVYGDCQICATADVKTMAKDGSTCDLGANKSNNPELLAKDGACKIPICKNSSAVCVKINSSLTQSFTCSEDASNLDLSSGGYPAPLRDYSNNYPCGQLWWERECTNVLLCPLTGVHPDWVFVGKSCPGGESCVIDKTATIVPITTRANIPNGTNKELIASYSNSRCY